MKNAHEGSVLQGRAPGLAWRPLGQSPAAGGQRGMWNARQRSQGTVLQGFVGLVKEF